MILEISSAHLAEDKGVEDGVCYHAAPRNLARDAQAEAQHAHAVCLIVCVSLEGREGLGYIGGGYKRVHSEAA